MKATDSHDYCQTGSLWHDLIDEIKHTEPKEEIIKVKSLTEKINEVSIPMFPPTHG